MSDLQGLAEDFDLITEIAYDLSQQFDGVQISDRKRKVSTFYLAKIVPECMSLLRVIPGSRFTNSRELFDFATFCSISRNLIEASNLHWYYCIDITDKEQSAFRFNLYDFHDYRATIQIGRFIGADEQELETLQERCNEIKGHFKNDHIFNGLLPEVQRQILKGRKCSEFNQTEISDKRGLDIDIFNGIYKVLSTNTHSTPSAISSIVLSRIHGQAMHNAFACLVLSYTACFVADMVKNVGEIWRIQFAKPESKEIIYSYSESLSDST